MKTFASALLVSVVLSVALAWAARPVAYFQATPLVDFQPGQLYLGQFPGNLYENGSNSAPSDYDALGQSIAAQVVPLNAAGNQDFRAGKIVALSVGMSNTADEWCGQSTACTSRGMNSSFMDQAARDPAVNHTTLTLLNGAYSGQDATTWACAIEVCGGGTQNQYDRIRDTVLIPNGLTEAQVQVVWLKQADRRNTYFLPNPRADAYMLEAEMGQILRALHTRWPHVKLVFLSSRIYAGYAGTATVQGRDQGPIEPFAYETGFALKWLVQAKIDQWRRGVIDPVAGDLSGIPFLAWDENTYLWGSGRQNPSGSHALSWASQDYEHDMIHPDTAGIAKVGSRLLQFFKSSAYTRSWFLR
jgi:hypothetical protein